MPAWICATCGNHYPEGESPPRECVICADERQWVPSSGQIDRIYGGWWEPVLRARARAVLRSSADRYIQFLRGEVAVD